MKCLILSSNTGAGHNSCAGAIQESFMERGIPCDVRDGLGFLSKDASRFISEWHSRLYRTAPRLYGEGYNFAQKHSTGMDDDSLLVRVLGIGAGRLEACIVSQGYTHVICTHLFPAMMLTHLQRQRHLPVVTAFVSTDYTASPGYEAIDLDWCFVPAPQIAGEFARPGMAPDRIISCGMPVKKAFRSRGDQAASKQALGIDPGHRHLLVMSGSMGCGPLKKVMKHLAKRASNNVDISVICGMNHKLSRQLSRLLGDRKNIHIHDYVDQIPLFMDSADLYLTKAGGLSVSEALFKGLPMVLIDAVEGCESHNMRYCLEQGAARTADGAEAIADLCLALIEDDGVLSSMAQACQNTSRLPGADRILNCLMGSEVPRDGI